MEAAMRQNAQEFRDNPEPAPMEFEMMLGVPI